MCAISPYKSIYSLLILQVEKVCFFTKKSTIFGDRFLRPTSSNCGAYDDQRGAYRRAKSEFLGFMWCGIKIFAYVCKNLGLLKTNW